MRDNLINLFLFVFCINCNAQNFNCNILNPMDSIQKVDLKNRILQWQGIRSSQNWVCPEKVIAVSFVFLQNEQGGGITLMRIVMVLDIVLITDLILHMPLLNQ